MAPVGRWDWAKGRSKRGKPHCVALVLYWLRTAPPLVPQQRLCAASAAAPFQPGALPLAGCNSRDGGMRHTETIINVITVTMQVCTPSCVRRARQTPHPPRASPDTAGGPEPRRPEAGDYQRKKEEEGRGREGQAGERDARGCAAWGQGAQQLRHLRVQQPRGSARARMHKRAERFTFEAAGAAAAEEECLGGGGGDRTAPCLSEGLRRRSATAHQHTDEAHAHKDAGAWRYLHARSFVDTCVSIVDVAV